MGNMDMENKQLKQHDKRGEVMSIFDYGGVLWQLPTGEAGLQACREPRLREIADARLALPPSAGGPPESVKV